jgi:predicted ATP-grasp superfamily ATP-dependent carboligase
MKPLTNGRAVIPASGGLGVLAALRDLRRAGIEAICGPPSLTSPLRPSRAASWGRPQLPSSGKQEDAFQWLLGASQPGSMTALIPAPDDLVWLAAERQAELCERYQLYYPAGKVVYSLLHKQRLHEAAAASGVATPPSWFPADREEAESIARRVAVPLVLKPKTHIGIRGWTKGAISKSWQALPPVYERVSRQLRYDPHVLARDPALKVPFLQRYYPGAGASVYNLYGFIDTTGDLDGFSASRKVLQYPRKLGVGVCFEAAPVSKELAARLAGMLHAVGYYGMFEAEFIDRDGELLLIDFNPRLFQSVGFTIARGLRLPLIWYLAANGDWAGVEEQLAPSRGFEDGSGQPSRWVHRVALETMVATRLATFRMGPGEAKTWLSWLTDKRSRTMDAAWTKDDPWPGRLNGLQHLAMFARDPKYLYGTFVRD